eukprot:2300935-Heterocapsa_arctica.AAC.1
MDMDKTSKYGYGQDLKRPQNMDMAKTRKDLKIWIWTRPQLWTRPHFGWTIAQRTNCYES